jgi:transposase-like protein
MGRRGGSYPSELRIRALRMVREQPEGCATQWEAIRMVARQLGCAAETLRRWVREAERCAAAAKRQG